MPIILRQNENLIKVVRRHWVFLTPIFFTWPWLVLVPLVVHFGFDFDFFGYWGWTITILSLAVFLALLYKFFLWRHNVLVITDQRIVENEQRGFFSKTVTELLYRDILEISYDKEGLGSSLYNFGDIKIRTASENEIVVLEIPKPEEVVEAINGARMKLVTNINV